MIQATEHQSNKPVIFLPETSGQNRVEGGAYLRNLPSKQEYQDCIIIFYAGSHKILQ